MEYIFESLKETLKETIENLKSKLSTWQKNKDVRFVLTSTGTVLLM